MFGKIKYISDGNIYVELKENVELSSNVMNMHVAIIDTEKVLLGEVDEIKDGIAIIKMLGEFKDGKLSSGIIRKPLLTAGIRPLKPEELPIILGQEGKNSLLIGHSPFYQDANIYTDINTLFGHHFAIFGNSGSGKSCSLARLIQNVFHNQNAYPFKANMILFDISGEYSSAFKNLNQINSNYNYRVFSTNPNYGEPLRIPIWLLNSDDISLLLMCNSHTQLPIIERMLKLTKIFAQNGNDSDKIKNHLIAKAMISVLYNNQTAVSKRNDIFAIMDTCATNEFNLEAPVEGIGYVRKFRECFQIDKQGAFSESILITNYITSFVNEEYDNYEPKGEAFYTLEDMEKALNFALISEGWYKNEMSYVDASTIKVRLHSLITGKYNEIFRYDAQVDVEKYLTSLLIFNNKRHQLININLDDMDDNMAAVITKVFSRIIFDFSKSLTNRASLPFHILVDEAHRYIKNDSDTYLIGYNIFERIAKEGRKYGVLLGIISQRPVELSDTVISQCSNFLIFKTNHPKDSEYIKNMIPNINAEIVEKQKTLQSGICLAFGNAFRIPLMVKFDMPDPKINADNCDIARNWGNQ